MKAVGYAKPLPIDDPESSLDLELQDTIATGRDLLVEVMAVSVNPVDVKERASKGPKKEGEYRVLGFDAAGIVRAVGSVVALCKAGADVFYAGSYLRQGSNAQLQLVDEHIVAKKPKSLSFLHAASLLLTTLVAWEFVRINAITYVGTINAGNEGARVESGHAHGKVVHEFRAVGMRRWLVSPIACSARSRNDSRSTRMNSCGPNVSTRRGSFP